MAAATETVQNFGRVAVQARVSGILVTLTATATVYATASGGLPIDLASALITAAPFSMPYINPADVAGVESIGMSTNGFQVGNLALGTPTYGPLAYPFAGGSQSNVRPDQALVTCPATIRLWATGAANHGAFTEIADGAVTDTVQFLLLVAIGGTNTN